MPDSSSEPGGEAGSAGPVAEGIPSLGGLISTVTESLASLLAGKVRLAELEFSRDLAVLLPALALLAAFTGLLFLALGFAGAGAAIVLGRVMGSPGLGMLVVAGIYLTAGIATGVAARSRLRRLRNLLRETRADLKRDLEWLKNLP